MPSFAEYTRFDGTGLADLIRRREVTAAEVIEAASARIDGSNPGINAVIHRMDGAARAQVAAGLGAGPFAGVPFLLKDLLSFYRGEPFNCGSRFLDGFIPDHDSELVGRYRSAGFVALGKTNTPEFGLTPYTEPARFGPTLNPWHSGRTSGGSSGGSAAAVAARMVPIASGGDGGGSIRIPASCCGIFGLKPTRGRTPTGPDYGQLWNGAVVEHVLTRSVRDSAAVLDHTAGPDVGAPYYPPPPVRPYADEVALPPGKLRIAWTTQPFLGKSVHPDCEAAVRDAADLLGRLGHDVREAAPSIDGPAFARAFVRMLCAEVRGDIEGAGLALGRKPTRAGFEPTTWVIGLLGRSITGAELAQANRVLERQARSVAALFVDYDVLLTPTLAVPPFPTGSLQPKPAERMLLAAAGWLGTGRPLQALGILDQMAAEVFQAVPYTAVFNVTGQPAMSVPLTWNAEGLPIGVHFVGRYADEATLFRLAGQLERERPWADRSPPEPPPRGQSA